MKHLSIFRSVLGIALVLVLGTGSLLATAQPPTRRPRPNRQTKAKQEPNTEIGSARILSTLGSAILNPKIKDPLSSHLFALTKRPEVYAEIKITSRQRESLEKLQDALSEQLFSKMHDAVEGDILDPAGLKELPPDERAKQEREFAQQSRERSKSALVEFQGDIEEELTKIFTKKQMTRLKQLDLQWRGPLALGDKKIGEEFELDDQQKEDLDEIVNEFRTVQAEISRDVVQRSLNLAPTTPSGRGTTPEDNAFVPQDAESRKTTPPDPKQFQQKMMQKIVEAQAELDKALKPLEKRVLALLSPDQKQLWKEMQGAKFLFRAVE